MEISWANRFQLLLAVSWGLGGLETPAGAQNVLCYTAFDATTGTCSDLLEDGVTQDDCCLNHQYGFRLHEGAPCQACRLAEWSGWSLWSPCSVSCQEGVRRRTRTCYGQGKCVGGPRQWETEACNLKDCCPVMGGWSEWSGWTPCSVTCLRGVQTRERTCTNPVPQCGGSCLGDNREAQSCDTNQICPTHGNWGSWGPWGACPATCTPEGPGPKPRQQRLRQCNNPSPSRDPPGNRCPGSDRDDQDCRGLPFCPQDGNWGTWRSHGPCSVTCGVGRVVEKRLCDNPAPKYGGKNCPGEDTHRHICSTKVPCPVDGRLTEWTPWSTCTRSGTTMRISCDEISGLQKRSRLCTGKAHNGKSCGGSKFEMRSCYNAQGCRWPGAWTEWSPWSLCEPPCGPNPMKSRTRECKANYPDYSPIVEGENGKIQNVSFWGTPFPMCDPLDGQKLKVVEKVPCQNVPPCED
ncbi:properdin isoform X2 [Hemicordylus capensis]|uniref:properdin isoform X2 n=1 Tax=Hemicordylus capensis TaxID=884348 RepID=UPI00230490FD|nr:properdin isoform X2 [Hemicordylus capensis]